ncbi:MAG: CheR family methyltransferase [Candidatus Heimdallarchaeota archaeon]
MEDLEEWFVESKRQRKRLSRHASKVRYLWKDSSTSSKKSKERNNANSEATRRVAVNKAHPAKKSGSKSHKRKTVQNSGPHPFMKLKKIPDEDVLPKLKKELLHMGFNISSYKSNYLKRRLRVLLRRAACSTYSEYLQKLRQDPREVDKLKKAFSINVTRFFRNLDSFWAVQRLVLPELFLKGSSKGIVKIWSAGCAMGPEPYTLAMLVRDFRIRHPSSRKARIVGTDLNPDLLRIAELGEFTNETFEETPASFKSKYTTQVGNERFRINGPVRSMVQFQQHDLLSPVSMGSQDFISCRNVLIYFSREQQEKIFTSFSHSLSEGGILLLGRTETLPFTYRNEFEMVDGRHRIYRRSAAT